MLGGFVKSKFQMLVIISFKLKFFLCNYTLYLLVKQASVIMDRRCLVSLSSVVGCIVGLKPELPGIPCEMSDVGYFLVIFSVSQTLINNLLVIFRCSLRTVVNRPTRCQPSSFAVAL